MPGSTIGISVAQRSQRTHEYHEEIVKVVQRQSRIEYYTAEMKGSRIGFEVLLYLRNKELSATIHIFSCAVQ